MKATYSGINIQRILIGKATTARDEKAVLPPDEVRLIPGLNDVPDELAAAFQEHPAVKALVREGKLKLEAGHRFESTKAIELVREIEECLDVPALRRLREKDQRPQIVAAIDAQLGKIDAMAAGKPKAAADQQPEA